MLEGYSVLQNGVIKQDNAHLIDYNQLYVNQRYNTYGELGMQMAYLRLGYIVGALGFVPSSILDVGYGNGDFLKSCSGIIKKCYGNDISGYPIPDNCKFVKDIFADEYTVVTFFDVLEHFEDINFVKDLKCQYVVISVPNCHYFSDDWFYNWKHRRFNEHIYHFNKAALINFMNSQGFSMLEITNIEDTIRKPIDEHENIITAVFKKK